MPRPASPGPRSTSVMAIYQQLRHRTRWPSWGTFNIGVRSWSKMWSSDPAKEPLISTEAWPTSAPAATTATAQ
jgi:hypothetical protein